MDHVAENVRSFSRVIRRLKGTLTKLMFRVGAGQPAWDVGIGYIRREDRVSGWWQTFDAYRRNARQWVLMPKVWLMIGHLSQQHALTHLRSRQWSRLEYNDGSGPRPRLQEKTRVSKRREGSSLILRGSSREAQIRFGQWGFTLRPAPGKLGPGGSTRGSSYPFKMLSGRFIMQHNPSHITAC